MLENLHVVVVAVAKRIRNSKFKGKQRAAKLQIIVCIFSINNLVILDKHVKTNQKAVILSTSML
jgi:hypothetical protein